MFKQFLMGSILLSATSFAGCRLGFSQRDEIEGTLLHLFGQKCDAIDMTADTLIKAIDDRIGLMLA